jgi:hypothetical protein
VYGRLVVDAPYAIASQPTAGAAISALGQSEIASLACGLLAMTFVVHPLASDRA